MLVTIDNGATSKHMQLADNKDIQNMLNDK